ncbi:hypothetical protein TIFTF001_037673 [Ficus carica]|uniref:Uncharacterized protein n=1 Tax=Ficus carica TaxID=3494 RepID=A0AA88JDU5_FICCA|nr:hypothetical protein TIFTF001_037662 [Ficus carica]GMN68608.1 hypothetical protein TIFTF001_037665 [Ficus carica]GMN68613.1 hypothetical protein TIFTF001_037670 [Ficus carica]GMN68616.1 hypothetical protein TIFTF001_037673 [Ficus carica]
MVDLVKFHLNPPLSSDLTSKAFAFSWPEYSVELAVQFGGRGTSEWAGLERERVGFEEGVMAF